METLGHFVNGRAVPGRSNRTHDIYDPVRGAVQRQVSLATRDEVDAAFDAASAARSKEENEAFGKRWSETLDDEGHTDQILMVVHYKGSGG